MPKKYICASVAAETAKNNTPPANGGATPATEPDWLRPLVEKIIGEVAAKPTAPTPFGDFPALVRHFPMYGERPLRQLVKDKVFPVCRPPKVEKIGVPHPFLRGGAFEIFPRRDRGLRKQPTMKSPKIKTARTRAARSSSRRTDATASAQPQPAPAPDASAPMPAPRE